MATILLVLTTVLGQNESCGHYFGRSEAQTWNSSVFTTIVDVDVFVGFPRGEQTFVHHAGPTSVCIQPSPPTGCHRYYVAQYTGCMAPCALSTGDATALAGRMDSSGAFDRANGVLRSCASCLQQVSLYCLGPSSPLPQYRNHPIACACPGTVRAQSNNVGASNGAEGAFFIGGIGVGVCIALVGAAVLSGKCMITKSMCSETSRQTTAQLRLMHDATGATDGANSSKANSSGYGSFPASKQKVSTTL